MAQRWTYDVFLNFRGTDTRTSFVEFLYHSLHQRGLYTFIDDERLERGEEITPALVKAIQESGIAIVVFSKNYASSTYCLDELVQIMECMKGEGRLVLPVFYEVDPSEVRHQRNSYGEEFAKLEEKFQDNKEKVQKWRKALYEAANLSGFHYKNGSLVKHIERIVEKVSKKINHIPLHVVDHSVGLESQLLEVTSLLELWNDEGVNMIGICGIGGIGKTTIAHALYNSIADQFESSCFLADVREKSTKDGLVELQKTLLSELLEENNIKFSDVCQGISILKLRLFRKKVLLILDDVDKLKQLKAIAGGLDWFGSRSRVIIIARDKHMLVTHGVAKLYEVKELNWSKALELFSWNAFKNNEVDLNYVDLSNRVLRYACGLPLALEVIGSYLFGKSRDEWNSALDKYERSPNQELYEILKLSYDSLDEDVKGIFLDIDCFFNGDGITYVKEMLRACNFHPEDGIRVLMDKSLIKYDASNRVVRMHDLIRDMGGEIVRQESISELGKRSRLWFAEDIVHVLEEKMGTDKIEAIRLYMREDKEVQWSGMAFKEMKRLRVLIIENARFSTAPKHLPNSLRVLDWSGYPSSLPSDFHPKKLVILNLPESCLETFKPLKKFESLSAVDFRDCKILTEVPNLFGVPNLGSLCLDNCTNLTKVHPSIGFLDKLIYLSAKGCTQLLTLVPCIKLTSLVILNLRDCSRLESFPEVAGRMDNIREVNLNYTAISELPLSIGNLIGLERLFLMGCKRLHQLPYSIKTLPKLEVIMAFGCKGLRLYEQYGDPEYVISEVNGMMFFDVSESPIERWFGEQQCFLKAYTVILSDNFIQVRKPSKDAFYCHLSSPGSSLSFRFRNQFPRISLTVVGGPNIRINNTALEFKLCLLINGAKQFITSCNHMFSASGMLWRNLQCDVVCEAEKLFTEREWNDVEVSCELKYHRPCDYKLATTGNHMGMVVGTIDCIEVYVPLEKISMEDVEFRLRNRGSEAARREEMDAHYVSLQSLEEARQVVEDTFLSAAARAVDTVVGAEAGEDAGRNAEEG